MCDIISHAEVKDDPDMIQDFIIVWNYCLDQGIVEAAYIIAQNNQIVELAAINMLTVITDETEKEMHDLMVSLNKCHFDLYSIPAEYQCLIA